MKRPDLLIVIPAQLHGGLLPRKVLRFLNDRPLLLHAVEISSGVVESTQQIVVVTDDDEVALLSEREGCGVVLDEEIRESLLYRVLEKEEARCGRPFQAMLVLQPSAPLLKPLDLEKAVALVLTGEFDSVISACGAVHHTWMKVDGRCVSDCRLWSQQSGVRMYRETGGFIVSRRSAIRPDRFVGFGVGLALVPQERAIDIASSLEWWICERLLRRKRIVFVVAGNREIGMGHIYRALQLAHQINNHEVTFVCTRNSDLAAKVFAENRYETLMQGDEPLSELVLRSAPDLVINDFLDTDAVYVSALKRAGVKVISFEDLGNGAAHADLVINAVYWEPSPMPNHRVGPDFFSIRDEFLQCPPRPFTPGVEEMLITFGGVDEANLTSRVLDVIWKEALSRKIRLSVVTGAGYGHGGQLDALVQSIGSPLITRANGTKRMSEYMGRADLAFSSAGRTLFELATMRVPTIVMACNTREESHPFAFSHSGFSYLGRHDQVSNQELLNIFRLLLDQPEQRRTMRQCLEHFDFRRGKTRVLDEIAKVLGTSLR